MNRKEQIAAIRAQLDALEAQDATPDVPAADPYADALTAVGTLAKANVALPDHIEFGGDDEEVIDEMVAKGASAAIDEGGDEIDALPLIQALLAGHNRQSKGLEAVGAVALAGRRDVGVLAKAVELLMGSVGDLRTELRDYLDRGRGSASRAVAREALAKSATPGEGSAGARVQRSELDALSGRDVLAKATFAGMRDNRLLNAGEIGRLEAYVSGDPDFTLSGLREGRYGDPDPGLALRVEQAIAATA